MNHNDLRVLTLAATAATSVACTIELEEDSRLLAVDSKEFSGTVKWRADITGECVPKLVGNGCKEGHDQYFGVEPLEPKDGKWTKVDAAQEETWFACGDLTVTDGECDNETKKLEQTVDWSLDLCPGECDTYTFERAWGDNDILSWNIVVKVRYAVKCCYDPPDAGAENCTVSGKYWLGSGQPESNKVTHELAYAADKGSRSCGQDAGVDGGSGSGSGSALSYDQSWSDPPVSVLDRAFASDAGPAEDDNGPDTMPGNCGEPDRDSEPYE